MIDEIQAAIINMAEALFGGLTALAAATAGRLMYHSGEVRQGRRSFFSIELVWEIPIAICAAIIGRSLGEYFGLSVNINTGLTAVLAYLGPRGTEELIERILKSNNGDYK